MALADASAIQAGGAYIDLGTRIGAAFDTGISQAKAKMVVASTDIALSSKSAFDRAYGDPSQAMSKIFMKIAAPVTVATLALNTVASAIKVHSARMDAAAITTTGKTSEILAANLKVQDALSSTMQAIPLFGAPIAQMWNALADRNAAERTIALFQRVEKGAEELTQKAQTAVRTAHLAWLAATKAPAATVIATQAKYTEEDTEAERIKAAEVYATALAARKTAKENFERAKKEMEFFTAQRGRKLVPKEVEEKFIETRTILANQEKALAAAEKGYDDLEKAQEENAKATARNIEEANKAATIRKNEETLARQHAWAVEKERMEEEGSERARLDKEMATQEKEALDRAEAMRWKVIAIKAAIDKALARTGTSADRREKEAVAAREGALVAASRRTALEAAIYKPGEALVTFGTPLIQQMGASGSGIQELAKRTAQATEETAQNTKEIVDRLPAGTIIQ